MAVLVGLLAIGGVIFTLHQKGNADTASTKPAVHASPSSSPTPTARRVDLSNLENALNGGTVAKQRQAFAPEIRGGLTKLMFPTSVGGKRTVVVIDNQTFQVDPADKNSAMVKATVSNNLGSYELRLVQEQGTWFIVYTTEVK